MNLPLIFMECMDLFVYIGVVSMVGKYDVVIPWSRYFVRPIWAIKSSHPFICFSYFHAFLGNGEYLLTYLLIFISKDCMNFWCYLVSFKKILFLTIRLRNCNCNCTIYVPWLQHDLHFYSKRSDNSSYL